MNDHYFHVIKEVLRSEKREKKSRIMKKLFPENCIFLYFCFEADCSIVWCYTALALQAMSRHFCSLRDAILSHINAEKRKLFQDLPKISSGLSQLSLFDRDSRQSRMSLQQLGVIQSQRQVWRPIRGLPETSVAILRSWLFEHFLHP